MKAIDSLLAGLIDYAGLYPPAGLDMHSAVRSYLSYGRSKHAPALGRFIVDLNRLTELREEVGDSMRDMRLSVIATPAADWESLALLLEDGFPIDMVEVKPTRTSEIERITKRIPSTLKTYCEVPVDPPDSNLFEAISAAGACAKLRMGGVVAEAFPSARATARTLKALVDRRIVFKATAGLHHAIRSSHPFTYEPKSAAGIMHGFLNLCCAAALLHFGGEAGEAERLLEEQNPDAWQVTPDAVAWCNFCWSAEQLGAVRREFLISFGSCSFEEPIHDLEAMGWL
jgi:hypothetical protein